MTAFDPKTDDLSDEADFEEQQTQVVISPVVDVAQNNMRIDKFLATALTGFSRNQIIRLIESDGVKRAGTDAFVDEPDYRVKTGESFLVIPPDAVPAKPEAEDIPLDILYEDKDILVVNKPAGMVVHPGAGNYTGTLVNALLFHCKDSLSGIGGVKRPGIVHRIDKNTSGILVVAKNDRAHVRLSEQFSKHTIERIYQAFVWGYVQEKTGLISGNIGRSALNRQKMAIVKTGGKSAITHYERMEAYGTLASHVQCILETGRTHQIRVHLSSVGHSLIGDEVYGVVPKQAPAYLRFFPRQALHAGFLAFLHPATNKRMVFEVPLPQDLAELKAFLEKSVASKE